MGAVAVPLSRSHSAIRYSQILSCFLLQILLMFISSGIVRVLVLIQVIWFQRRMLKAEHREACGAVRAPLNRSATPPRIRNNPTEYFACMFSVHFITFSFSENLHILLLYFCLSGDGERACLDTRINI